MRGRLSTRVPALVLGVAVLVTPTPSPGVFATPGETTGVVDTTRIGHATAVAVGPGGIGDPYYPDAGNRGYDARHYDLNVRYDPGKKELTGVSTMTAASDKDLSSFSLDFFGLTLDSVTVNGAPARTSRTETKLTVTPATPIAGGTDFTVVARYHGTPRRYQDDGFFITRDGATVVGQPRAAACWFPVNDHPSDKARYTFVITAPKGRSAIANGIPRGSETRDGWTSWRYEEPSPMAPYLATMSVGDFDIEISDHRGLPVVLAVNRHVEAGRRERMMAQLRATGGIIDFLATRFGPYPFTSAGGIVTSPDFTHDALENQARPVYSERDLSERLIVHELAHQWFGDSVSLESWKDIWLNEGFATYAEWMYDEHRGRATAEATFREYYARSVTGASWSPAPGDPGRDRMFANSVYHRGAMTLHALRRTVGEETFLTILRTWTSRHKDANATTDDFITIAGTVSGRDLTPLFRAWLHGQGKPPVP